MDNSTCQEEKEITPYIMIPEWVRESLIPLELQVYAALMSFADNKTRIAFPSTAKIVEKMTIYRVKNGERVKIYEPHPSTIRKAIASMVEIGVMEKRPRFLNNKQRSNEYYMPFDDPKAKTSIKPSDNDVTPAVKVVTSATNVKPIGESRLAALKEKKQPKKIILEAIDFLAQKELDAAIAAGRVRFPEQMHRRIRQDLIRLHLDRATSIVQQQPDINVTALVAKLSPVATTQRNNVDALSTTGAAQRAKMSELDERRRREAAEFVPCSRETAKRGFAELRQLVS